MQGQFPGSVPDFSQLLFFAFELVHFLEIPSFFTKLLVTVGRLQEGWKLTGAWGPGYFWAYLCVGELPGFVVSKRLNGKISVCEFAGKGRSILFFPSCWRLFSTSA